MRKPREGKECGITLQGDRACYMCGSPDLFSRDCPVSSNQYSMLQTGDAVYQGGMPAYGPPPYWNGLQFRPFPNVYATPGMMPYGSNMGPVNPYAVHSYMPSMFAGMQAPYYWSLQEVIGVEEFLLKVIAAIRNRTNILVEKASKT
ncbi:hypothetical protein C5167_042682 [Papaver somniferum]|uniref:CCHC-type domain-containing protein n=1 Tax=Papaver somniferum TaxID=3469 RepID=A0A4Y7L757_PAPSO|nr:hypothetical protein C5167_042682 [Papaver somniferum]